MTAKQQRVWDAVTGNHMLSVEPGFLVNRITLLGVHGDDTDLAFSIHWHDNELCEWEAEFTEGSLKRANFMGNQISLEDTQKATMHLCFHRMEQVSI